jgi:hypothetical protein
VGSAKGVGGRYNTRPELVVKNTQPEFDDFGHFVFAIVLFKEDGGTTARFYLH